MPCRMWTISRWKHHHMYQQTKKTDDKTDFLKAKENQKLLSHIRVPEPCQFECGRGQVNHLREIIFPGKSHIVMSAQYKDFTA